MAENSEIVLNVKINTEQVAERLATATKALAEHKQQQKELKKAMEESNGTNAIAAKMYAEVTAQIERESREVKSSTALLQAETLARIDDNSSLDEQRQALNAAQKAYAQLSGEEKKAADSAGGLREQIERLSDRVKQQEAAIGDTRRNVGNYAMQTAEAAGKMGLFGQGLQGVVNPIKNVTAGLKAASATPFLAVVSMLITILQKLSERFKGNAAAMEKLNELFGVFSGVGNIVNVIIDKIAEGLGWIADKALELAQKLGILGDAMKAGQEIAREDLAIQKEQQAAALKTAEDQKRIAELKAEANNKDQHSTKERLAMLQEAADLEEGIAKRQYDLAKREYELQVKKNAQSESSQEDLKKENDLRIAMLNAETALFNKRKELNGQMSELRKKESAELQAALAERSKITRDAAIQHMEDLRLIAQAEAETIQAQSEELAEQARAMLDALNEDEEEEDIPTPDEMAARMFGLDAEGVEYFRSLLDEGVSFAEAKTKAITDQTRRMAQGFATSFGQLGNAFSQMGSALGEYADESTEAAAAQKAFTLSGILLNQAQSISEGALAIAKGVESAAGIPFPANVPAIISIVAQIGGMIAGVMTSIMQAKQIFSEANTQKFATGGIVGGNSYTGDSVPAMLNSGEMVLNADSQKRLFDALTGNGDGTFGFNYEAMAAVVAAQPAPVMVLKELRDFEEKTATFDEIASI